MCVRHNSGEAIGDRSDEFNLGLFCPNLGFVHFRMYQLGYRNRLGGKIKLSPLKSSQL